LQRAKGVLRVRSSYKATRAGAWLWGLPENEPKPDTGKSVPGKYPPIASQAV